LTHVLVCGGQPHRGVGYVISYSRFTA